MTSELLEGAGHVRAAAERARRTDVPADRIGWLLAQADLLEGHTPAEQRVAVAGSPELHRLMDALADRSRAACSRALRVWVDRARARFGAWYEMFPRSVGSTPTRSGTFRDARSRLADIAAMGFDIVYLPPVHPIGASYRKGRNNRLQAEPDDPGSPWAIGSDAGGHTAVEPGLGTLDDFDRFREAAERAGLEVALDLAYQCSPDHPWVREHPEWFRHRPDGTIKYAENPPKKYQDIYPIDFECEDWRALWHELKAVVLFWIGHGVRIFRVDNPHTKTFGFWEWMIDAVRADHPDVIFLAEAFTRPRPMRRLAKAGFSQSYTYFTWRNTAAELQDYFTELTQTEAREYLRPNLFANTPDILHAYLQTGGRPAFETRLVLAATLGASYGIYSGFELCDNRGVPGTEEYHRLREVPVPPVGLGPPGQHQGAGDAGEPRAAREPGAAPGLHPAVPRHRQRRSAVLLEDVGRRRQHHPGRRQRRSVPHAARLGAGADCGVRHRPDGALHHARPADRRPPPLAGRVELRAARSDGDAGAHLQTGTADAP